MNLVITRQPGTDEGTPGVALLYDDRGKVYKWYTLEMPWRDNAEDVSCIPPGQYLATWTFSRHFNRDTYELFGVPNRTGIRIHRGNFAGDKSKGWHSDVKGCIVLGTALGRLIPDMKVKAQLAVLNSGIALVAFQNATEHLPIEVEIKLESASPKLDDDRAAVL